MKTYKERPLLLIPQEEAKKKILIQIEKANTIPNISINDNDDAHRWYEYTAELLLQIFSTDEITDEFTGRSSISLGGDISTGHYLKRLNSILERIDLYQEDNLNGISLSTTPLIDIERIFSKFHEVVKQIRHRYNDRSTLDIADEYDVQDLLHCLLKIYFEDIRPEEWTPSYAGGSSRMDFLIKSEKIVIEVKKTRKGLGAKEIGSQLADDIMRYRVHPDCNTLICFVYDPEERISNPKGIENDLNQQIGELQVKVCIVQK